MVDLLNKHVYLPNACRCVLFVLRPSVSVTVMQEGKDICSDEQQTGSGEYTVSSDRSVRWKPDPTGWAKNGTVGRVSQPAA